MVLLEDILGCGHISPSSSSVRRSREGSPTLFSEFSVSEPSLVGERPTTQRQYPVGTPWCPGIGTSWPPVDGPARGWRSKSGWLGAAPPRSRATSPNESRVPRETWISSVEGHARSSPAVCRPTPVSPNPYLPPRRTRRPGESVDTLLERPATAAENMLQPITPPTSPEYSKTPKDSGAKVKQSGATVKLTGGYGQTSSFGYTSSFPLFPHPSSLRSPSSHRQQRPQNQEPVGMGWSKVTEANGSVYYWHEPSGASQVSRSSCPGPPPHFLPSQVQ